MSINTLLKRIDSNVDVCLYTDNPDKFMYGRILASNEVDTAFYSISPEGGYDGVNMIPTDSISRIEVGGQYSAKMQSLIFENAYEQFSHTLCDDNIRNQLLELSFDENKVITIELLDSGYDDIYGIVKSVFDDGCIIINRIDEYGIDDGLVYIISDDITRITYENDRTRTIQKLIR